MHIALHHNGIIPPHKYGGTQRNITWLTQGLLSQGHRVTLVARPGSAVSGAEFLDIRAQSKLKPTYFDLVHYHETPSDIPKTPYLVTIHGNGQPGETFLPNTVFISASHAENHGSKIFVHNGINPDEYFIENHREDYLVFLAKASWSVKNLAGAVELARATKLPLLVMGSRQWPLGLNRLLPAWRGVRYLGMVDDRVKRHYLRRARALLFPVRWNEPFGNAVSEALASGCAVFGTPYGSLPELITPATGRLSADAEVLLDALNGFSVNPIACRERVLAGLTHMDMARSYLSLYEKVLNQKLLCAPEARPRTQSKVPAETLLPYRFLHSSCQIKL